MTRTLVLVAVAVAACASEPRAPAPPQQPVASDAAVATDPPEPVAPLIECIVRPEPVYCQAGVPFHDCPPTLAGSNAALGATGRLFSAAETRKARGSRPGACCYLEWTWMVCD